MSKKTKLELTWVGKSNRQRPEPRVLVQDASFSYHASGKVSDNDLFDNTLIYGDNLLALKALETSHRGMVKCVYIDPPFNTQQALTNYDDGVEHSIWLGLMRDRLEIIHSLLREDGTIFVHIDDNEIGYLIALMDEVFGRKNKCYIITFKQASATGHKAINPGCVSTTNFILIYAKNKESWSPNKLFTARERDKRYGQFILNPEEDFSSWRIVNLTRGYAEELGVTEKEARARLKQSPDDLDQFVIEHAEQVVQLGTSGNWRRAGIRDSLSGMTSFGGWS